MHRLTLFSWGYWGWGNVTPQLVQGVDAVEAERGFGPPVFVDIRISRAVRAVGFRDKAFQQLLGDDRYVWLKALGNTSVQTHSGPPIQIAKPEAASELIDIALAAASRQRRILFFCSCERPVDDSRQECHRVTVARLARAAAAMRGVPIETVEWPGGEPIEIPVNVPRTILRSMRAGRKTIPVAKPEPLALYAGLPWGSTVEVTDGRETVRALSGPALFTGGKWCLPIAAQADANGHAPAEWAARFRK